MDTYQAILNRRSIRRFKQKSVKKELFEKIVNAGRLAPSAANFQPLRFLVVNNEKLCKKVFENTGWAGYLKDWNPSADEQPAGYILILIADKENKWAERDAGLAAANMCLAAENENLGSCILLNFKGKNIRKILNIPEEYILDSVIALGFKNEKCKAVEMENESVEYFRDENDVLLVPKRKLKDVMFINKF